MLAKAAIRTRTSAPTSPGATGAGKKGGRLLSLDGGGVKGMVLARMLASMERVLGAPALHCFDWIAGTSTGGILALAIAMGKTPLECMALYFKLKDKVCGHFSC